MLNSPFESCLIILILLTKCIKTYLPCNELLTVIFDLQRPRESGRDAMDFQIVNRTTISLLLVTLPTLLLIVLRCLLLAITLPTGIFYRSYCDVSTNGNVTNSQVSLIFDGSYWYRYQQSECLLSFTNRIDKSIQNPYCLLQGQYPVPQSVESLSDQIMCFFSSKNMSLKL